MKKFTLLILLLFITVTSVFSQGSLCSDPIIIPTLPYSHTDDTGNYENNYQGAPGNSCGSYFTSFLYGNDVVYAYTATFTGSINFYLSTNVRDVGMFVYGSCDDIGQNCLAGITNQEILDETMDIEGFSVTQGTTYYLVISCAPPTETVEYTLNIMENICTPPNANYMVMSDCSITEEFLVIVDVTSMGDAQSVTVSDNYGLEAQYVTDLGTVTFGPYPNGTNVQFFVRSDQNFNCVRMSAPKTSLFCAPSNDFCVNAINLTGLTSPISGTTLNSTNQNFPVCSWNGQSGDVYYVFDVPNLHTLTIGLTETDFDAIVTALVGDCNENWVVMCEENDLATYTLVNDSGSTQTFYWVVDGTNGETGNFTLSWTLDDCMQPIAVYEVVPDCSEGDKFLIYTTLYEMGSAQSLIVSDNVGDMTQIITEPGQFIMGPYDNMTQVALTLTNEADPTCAFTSYEMTQEECPLSCVPATYYYTQQLICPNPGFMVTIHMTGLGTAESVTITDDQGNPSQTAGMGEYQFGPYVDYTTVTFTIVNNDNPGCFSTLQAISYTICPPSNDSCANPTALIPGGDFETGTLITTSEGATLSTEIPYPTCGNMFFNQAGKDVWYTVAIPASGRITIETGPSGSTAIPQLTDSVLQIYAGDCSNLAEYVCDDDSGNGSYSSVTLTDMNPGDVMYIRAFGKFGAQGAFKISAYDQSLLSVSTFEMVNLVSFPNPVKDVLQLSTAAAITNVEVFNLIGQKVYAKILNTSNSQIDMSQLSAGTYLVKVNADNQIKTIKIIKE